MPIRQVKLAKQPIEPVRIKTMALIQIENAIEAALVSIYNTYGQYNLRAPHSKQNARRMLKDLMIPTQPTTKQMNIKPHRQMNPEVTSLENEKKKRNPLLEKQEIQLEKIVAHPKYKNVKVVSYPRQQRMSFKNKFQPQKIVKQMKRPEQQNQSGIDDNIYQQQKSPASSQPRVPNEDLDKQEDDKAVYKDGEKQIIIYKGITNQMKESNWTDGRRSRKMCNNGNGHKFKNHSRFVNSYFNDLIANSDKSNVVVVETPKDSSIQEVKRQKNSQKQYDSELQSYLKLMRNQKQ